jgi:hypothetical protein
VHLNCGWVSELLGSELVIGVRGLVVVGISPDSPLEEAGFEPSVPPQEGTGSPAALIEIVPQPVLPTAKRTVRLLVRIRFPPAESHEQTALGEFRPREGGFPMHPSERGRSGHPPGKSIGMPRRQLLG